MTFDFTPTDNNEGWAFKVEGGYMFLNPEGVFGGLLANSLLERSAKGELRVTDITRARRVLNKEMIHQQIHMATERAFTIDEKVQLFDGFTITELEEIAAAYYGGSKKALQRELAILRNPSDPRYPRTRNRLAEEKLRADVQNLIDGETSEDVLAELSENAPRKGIFERNFIRARYMLGKGLRSFDDPRYAAGVKETAQTLRDMHNGYFPAQSSHGGTFSHDKPYAGYRTPIAPWPSSGGELGAVGNFSSVSAWEGLERS